jgi:hypothetical protein
MLRGRLSMGLPPYRPLEGSGSSNRVCAPSTAHHDVIFVDRWSGWRTAHESEDALENAGHGYTEDHGTSGNRHE